MLFLSQVCKSEKEKQMLWYLYLDLTPLNVLLLIISNCTKNIVKPGSWVRCIDNYDNIFIVKGFLWG